MKKLLTTFFTFFLITLLTSCAATAAPTTPVTATAIAIAVAPATAMTADTTVVSASSGELLANFSRLPDGSHRIIVTNPQKMLKHFFGKGGKLTGKPSSLCIHNYGLHSGTVGEFGCVQWFGNAGTFTIPAALVPSHSTGEYAARTSNGIYYPGFSKHWNGFTYTGVQIHYQANGGVDYMSW